MNRNQILIFVIFFCVSNAYSQISIHPPQLFIDPATRSGEIRITNTSNAIREIVMDSKFGYVGYDSLGNRQDVYNDSILLTKYSLSKYLKIFPPKLIIPPNESQIVRVFLRNLPTLEDGTYYTRFSALSNPLAEQIDSFANGKIRGAVIIKTSMISAIFYQKGILKTDLNFTFDKIYTDSLYTNLLFNTQVNGNSPFWGKLHYILTSDKEGKIAEADEPLSFYIPSKKKISFYKTSLTPGKYKIEFEYNTNREDVPEDNIIPFKTKNQEFEFIIN